MSVFLNATFRATGFRNAYNLSTCTAISFESHRGLPTLTIRWDGDVEIELRKTTVTDFFITPESEIENLPDIVRQFVDYCNK
jgi:hypothetical protein